MAAVFDETTTTMVESGKGTAAACRSLSRADLALRALLFAVTLSGLVVVATANQTALVAVPQVPGLVLSRAAKFNQLPAIIYLLVVLCLTCFYSLLTGLITSLKLISGSPPPSKTLFLLAAFDVLYAGIMASASGAAAAVSWIALKGNTHTNWNKICDPYYGEFCNHIGSSLVLGLVASVILVLLTILNAYSLYRRAVASSPKLPATRQSA